MRSPLDLVRSFIQNVWIERDLDEIPNYIAPDYQATGLRTKVLISGVDGVRINVQKVYSDYPALSIEIDDMFADGDKVATRLTFHPSPDSSISMREIIIHEVQDGLICQAWSIGSEWN